MIVRSRRFLSSVALAGLAVFTMSGTGAAQATDPAVGTWKLNVAKSKFSPGPAPKNLMVTILSVGQGVKVVVDGIGPDGNKTHWEYTANYDGKDYPVTGNPLSDMVAAKRINPTTVELTNKMGGKLTTTSSAVVSSDGKTLTVTTKGTTAKGEAIDNVAVYERT